MTAEGVFTETIHAPLRLRICGLLRSVDGIDFAVLRETLGVSDATLSKHLKVLTDSRLVAMSKGASASRTDFRRVTWVSATAVGKRAFDDHVRALRTITAGCSAPSTRIAPSPPTQRGKHTS